MGIFAGFISNPHHVNAIWWICFGIAGWEGLLSRYIDDHKFIPPPAPPRDPLPIPKYAPLLSEHWGERDTAAS